jgi:hypothetical protein
MALLTVRLAGGPCDGLTRPAPGGDWHGAERRAIAVLDDDAHLHHIYDLAAEQSPCSAPDVLVFRYRGTLVQPEHAG